MRKIDPNNPSADRFQILEAIRAGVGNETNWYVEMANRVFGTVHQEYIIKDKSPILRTLGSQITIASNHALLGILFIDQVKVGTPCEQDQIDIFLTQHMTQQ